MLSNGILLYLNETIKGDGLETCPINRTLSLRKTYSICLVDKRNLSNSLLNKRIDYTIEMVMT